jgi:hypothetical protein
MVAPDDGAPEARPPRLTDLVALCRRLNESGTRYVVIGGMAIIQAGFVRATEDIALLVDVAPDNVAALREALRSLPDRAIDEMADDDIERYVVVRVADEIVVDLMKAACGIEYAEAAGMVEEVTIEGVRIPFASPALLWRTKQTMRDKDRQDRAFLQSVLPPDARR